METPTRDACRARKCKLHGIVHGTSCIESARDASFREAGGACGSQHPVASEPELEIVLSHHCQLCSGCLAPLCLPKASVLLALSSPRLLPPSLARPRGRRRQTRLTHLPVVGRSSKVYGPTWGAARRSRARVARRAGGNRGGSQRDGVRTPPLVGGNGRRSSGAGTAQHWALQAISHKATPAFSGLALLERRAQRHRHTAQPPNRRDRPHEALLR